MGICVILCQNTFKIPMAGFLGEYEVALDAKGRFLLPAGFKKQLPDDARSFVVARGMETCLNLYTISDWETLSEKISRYNDLKPAVQKFKRLFFSGATPVELDAAGRLLLPKPLQEFAGLKKDIVLSSQGNRIEIWDSVCYYEYLKANAADLGSLADEISGGDYLDPF